MAPEQKVKWAILAKDASWHEVAPPEYVGDSIDQLFDRLVEDGVHWDAMNEVRWGEFETDLPCDSSRHYESRAVAAKMPDGTWVGWTRWYGGGKHGNPEEIDWMCGAYDVDCHEEEKVVVVLTFSRARP